MPHYSLEELSAGVSEAQRFQRKTASHAQGAAGILNAVRAGIDSIEHGIFMDETCLQEMLAQDVYLVPTCAALRNIVDNAAQGIPDFIVEKSRRVIESHHQSIKMYHDAGGKIAMGTDAGTPFNHHGKNALELRYMVDYGMTTEATLTAATQHGAGFNGVARKEVLLPAANMPIY